MMNNEQTEKRIAEIRKLLELRETEDLIAIWENKEQEEWTAEAYMAIQRILQERLGRELPTRIERPLHDTLDDSQQVELGTQAFKQAEAWLERNDLEKALQAIQEAIRIAPHSASAYNLQGLIYDAMGQLVEAISSYREAVRLDPGFDEAQENLREAQKELGLNSQLPQARQHLEQAIALVDNDELDSALSECELAIQAAPEYAIAHNNKGMILEELGRFEEAIESFQTAIRLDPQFYAARENLCNARIKWREEQYLLISRGNFEVLEDETNPQPVEDKIDEIPLDELEDETSELNAVYDPEALAFYLDEKAILLPGWPGYRTRPGRSGYDYLDYNFEWGHMEGVLLRSLFTGRLQTHNPIYLILMVFVGAIYLLPGYLIFLCLNVKFWDLSNFILLLLFSPFIALGIALFANVWISLSSWNLEGRNSIISN